MTATDIEALLNEAIVAVLDIDAGVVAITGRPSGNILPMQDVGTLGLPVLLYLLIDLASNGSAGDTRLALFQFSAIAEGNDAASTTAALMERIELALTEPALAAQGLDACPYGRPRRRRIAADADASRAVARADMDFTLLVTK
jgi:hypothetical protein